MENFKHTLKGAWVAVRAKATKSDSIEVYAFLRKQQKLAKLNQIKSRYPLLLLACLLTDANAFKLFILSMVAKKLSLHLLANMLND